MSSFSIALSGLSADNTALDVVGNNLANLNTQGFKADEITFKDVMGQVSGSEQIGAGVSPPTTGKQFTQGSLTATSGPFDAAIQGNGFFVLSNPNGQTQYTRDGSFQINSQGYLTTSTGELVQGWSAAGGVLSTAGPLSSINVSTLSAQPPLATDAMTLSANLNSAAATGDTFSTPIQVVDSLGATHTLTVDFKKTDANAWSYEVSIPGVDLTSGTAGTPSSLTTGSLTFDSSGKLTSPAAGAPVAVAATGLADGAADLNINWSLFDPTGTSLLTQYSQPSAASASTQTGQSAADVTSVQIGAGGVLTATYSNGQQAAIAQLGLASIGNPDSLIAVGQNNYQVSANTQTPSTGAPNTGTRGTIVGGSIESSNVDLAREFTNLIVYQSGYQANSKVISTMDQLVQALFAAKQ